MDRNKRRYIEPLNDLINTVKNIQNQLDGESVMVGAETVMVDNQPAHEIVHYSGAGGGVRPSTYEECDYMASNFDYKDNNLQKVKVFRSSNHYFS